MEWDIRNDQPIYTQLIQQVTLAILSGTFPCGGRLPPVREMAQPMTPPPMTSTSYMIHLSFLKTKSHAKAPGVSSGQFCMAQHLTA